MKKFNDWLGAKLAYGLSTMEAFYVVSAFVIIPLLFQTPHDLVGWIQYIVQSFFQGAALPVLGYVSRISGEKQEKIIRETHDIVMQELKLMKQDALYEKEERQELKMIIHELSEHVFHREGEK